MSGVGLLPISPAHGVVTSARLNIVVRLNPASFNASRSRVMPSWLRLHPIHIHNTPGLADSGGWRKAVSSSSPRSVAVRDSASISTVRRATQRFLSGRFRVMV